ncbi:MAG TPA: RIP metalloprotease RseP [Chitinophagaceae bacterium]|nr:RIP metalloprotease RseP [Chitinophagaceae bacterium]
MTLLVIDWGSVGIKTLQFILSFSILVTLHELGHFLTARWFKCRVEKFYLFFNPWFSLFKKKVGDTEYGIGWVPFGGYVKISGMIDESMDKEAMKLPPQPYEFRSKKAWQRLIIMTAGVIVNVLLAIVIFIGITWKWGDEYLPGKNMTWGVVADTLAQKIGIQSGDKIVAVDTTEVADFFTLPRSIILDEATSLTVDRNGTIKNIPLTKEFIQELNRNKFEGFVEIRIPVIVDSIEEDKAHFLDKTNKLQKGDTLVGLNGIAFRYYDQLDSLRKQYKGQEVTITALRGNDTVRIRAKLDTAGKVGFDPVNAMDSLFKGKTVKKEYTFAESVPVGFTKCFATLGRYIAGLRQIFAGNISAKDSLGSVISIGNTFPGVWDWQRFWMLTAIFSIILAFMNILPIPALDGGHALFTIYEMITGRKPSDKFMEYAQMVGMVLLLGLMAYALGLDFWRTFFKH